MTPLLTRVYSPDDYGLFIFFLSLLSITSMISSGRYYLAIILPENEDDADILKNISLFLNILFSFFSLMILLLFYYFSILSYYLCYHLMMNISI